MVTLIIHLTVYMKVSTELFMLTPFFKTPLEKFNDFQSLTY